MLAGLQAMALLRRSGWMQLCQPSCSRRRWNRRILRSGVQREFLESTDGALPWPRRSLQVRRLGAIHWTDPYSVSGPHALYLEITRGKLAAGGRLAMGDAMSLSRCRGWLARADQ